jgi:hypothetical protein
VEHAKRLMLPRGRRRIRDTLASNLAELGVSSG